MTDAKSDHRERLEDTLAGLETAIRACDSARDLVALHRLRVEVSEKLDALDVDAGEEVTGLDEFTAALRAKRGPGSSAVG